MFVLLSQKDEVLFINKCSLLLLFIPFNDIRCGLGILDFPLIIKNFQRVIIYVGVLGYRVPLASAFNCCRLSLVAEQGELGVEAWTNEES